MTHQRLVIGFAAAAVLASANAPAIESADVHVFRDTARVVAVEPIYERVSRQTSGRCWDERVGYEGRTRDPAPPIVAGGLIGGLLGNQVAGSGDRTEGTIAGALIGAGLGYTVAAKGEPSQYAVRERCEPGHREYYEELIGYRVKYRYNGQTFWTRTHRHPGDRIPVRVSVEPVHPR